MLSVSAHSPFRAHSHSPSARSSTSNCRQQQCGRYHHYITLSNATERVVSLVLTAVISCDMYYVQSAAPPSAARGTVGEPFPYTDKTASAGSKSTAYEATAGGAALPEGGESVRHTVGMQQVAGSTQLGTSGPHFLRTAQRDAAESRRQGERARVESGPGYDGKAERATAGTGDAAAEAESDASASTTSEGREQRRLRTGDPSSWKSWREKYPLKRPGPASTMEVERRMEVETPEKEAKALDGKKVENGAEEKKGSEKVVVGKETGEEGGVNAEKEEKEEAEEGASTSKKQKEGRAEEGQEEEDEENKEEEEEERAEEKKREEGVEEGEGEQERKEKKEEEGDMRAKEKETEGREITNRNEEAEGKGRMKLLRADSLANRERIGLDKSMLPEYSLLTNFGRTPCFFSDAPGCGREIPREEKFPSNVLEVIRRTKALVGSTLWSPFMNRAFPHSRLWGGDERDSHHSASSCRLTFDLDTRIPTDEIRIYIVPAERRVGLAAERKVVRSEEDGAGSRVYGAETKLNVVAHIAEGCMVSDKLLNAGFIGWTSAWMPDGGVRVLVSFPSEAHARKLIQRKELKEESYKRLIEEEGLEQLTPIEKCLLSGRTETECDQLKREAGEKRERTISFSTKGYEGNEIRLPEFVCA